MNEVSNRTLALLLVAAILVSFGGTLLTINRFMGVSQEITGAVTEGADLSLTVSSLTEVNWSPTSISWGTGGFDTGSDGACVLDTNGNNGSQSGSNCSTIGNQFTTVTGGLNITNNGNTNVTLNITCGKTAATFMPAATNPGYRFNVTTLLGDACPRDSFDQAANETLVNCATSDIRICNETTHGFNWQSSNNKLKVHFTLHLPQDVTKQALSDTVTLRAFELPD